MEGPPRPASTPTKLASDIRPIVFGKEEKEDKAEKL